MKSSIKIYEASTMNTKKFMSMITTMLKIGFIGFGGGTALIPVIEEEIVEKKQDRDRRTI